VRLANQVDPDFVSDALDKNIFAGTGADNAISEMYDFRPFFL
jgi:hypothetical protein